jgi:hypothetical protein
MVRLRKFAHLSLSEQLLLLIALVLVVLVRLALWLVPFQVWRPLLQPVNPIPGSKRSSAPKIARAVATVSGYVPAATCLTQALATRLLLGWFGHQAVVHIGVVRKNSDRLDAHAWVTSNGRVVIGGSPSYLAQFAVLRELREQES